MKTDPDPVCVFRDGDGAAEGCFIGGWGEGVPYDLGLSNKEQFFLFFCLLIKVLLAIAQICRNGNCPLCQVFVLCRARASAFLPIRPSPGV